MAAATTAAAGAVSAGVALASAGPAGGTNGAHGLAAAAATSPNGRTAAARASGHPAVQGAARQPAPSRLKPSPVAHPGMHATPQVRATATPAASAPPAGQIAGKPAPTHPFLVYDSVVPSALPKGQVVAAYATGGRPAQPAELAGRGPVVWIDVVGTDPGADVLDVEPGCVSPAAVPGWVTQRLTAHPGTLAIIYTTIGEWPAAQSEVAGLPAAMRAQVRWWIADPTGYAHVVPGSDATQWYWGSSYDISTATPRFLAFPSLPLVRSAAGQVSRESGQPRARVKNSAAGQGFKRRRRAETTARHGAVPVPCRDSRHGRHHQVAPSCPGGTGSWSGEDGAICAQMTAG